MPTAALDVPLAHPSDLAALLPSSLGQSAAGSIPVWNGTDWSFIAPGSDAQVLVADSTLTLGVKYAAPPGGATAIVDGSVDRRHLKSTGWAPPTAIAENTDRFGRVENYTLVSGTLTLAGGLVLPRGRSIAGIAFQSVVTGGGVVAGQTNQWFCLVDQAGNVLAKTTDDTTTTWPQGVKALAFASPYVPVADIAVYLGCLVVATTMPAMHSNISTASVTGVAPITMATANTGLTTPASLGATVGALTALPNTPIWGYVF